MVKRQLAERRHFSTYIPDYGDPAAALLPHANKIGHDILQISLKNDEMKANNLLSQADVELSQFNAQWRAENSADPFNPEAQDKLQQGYNEIYGKYESQLPITQRRAWGGAKVKNMAQSKVSNVAWAVQQSMKNAEADYKDVAERTNLMTYEMAASGDIEGAVKYFQESFKKTSGFLNNNPVVPYDKKSEYNKNFLSDGAKSIATGAMFFNPELGKSLITGKTTQKEGESDEEYAKRSEEAKNRAAGFREDIGSVDAFKQILAYADTRQRQIDTENKIKSIEGLQNLTRGLAKSNIPITQQIASIESYALANPNTPSRYVTIAKNFANSYIKVDSPNANAVRAKLLQRTSDAKALWELDGDNDRYIDTIEAITYDAMASKDLSKPSATKVINEIDTNSRGTISEATASMIGGEYTQPKEGVINYREATNYSKRIPLNLGDELDFIRRVMNMSQQAGGNITPEKQQMIFQRVGEEMLKEIDPTFSNPKNLPLTAFKRRKTGEVLYDFSTGKAKVVKDGRWVDLKGNER